MRLRTYLREAAPYIVASWITPKGNVLDCGSLHHINFVLKNPQKFGLTDEDVRCIRYGDKTETGKKITTFRDGIDAESHDRIINKALEKGFIRLRKVRSSNYSFIWFADVYKFTNRIKKTMADWAYDLMNFGKEDKKTQVMFSSIEGNVPQNATLSGLANMTESHKNLLLITLNEMENLI